ncbi:MAG: dUTP diphosphatase [Clostridiales bacterium]|nr:dUTP diphosphatase [Clostridiales bacterium]
MKLNVKIRRTRPEAILPSYGSENAAGCDLYSCETKTIVPGGMEKFATGIAIEPERDDIVAAVCARSSLGTKYGVTLANSVGIIDSDYRGEISVTLLNQGSEPYEVRAGDRIAQMLFLPVFRAEFTETDSLADTERGSGGFGSTGR